MDAFELFRKLGAGAKFDLKRFSQDAVRFKLPTSRAGGNPSSQPLSVVDYFGTDRTSRAPTHSEKDDEEGDKAVCEAGGKRKRTDEEHVTTKVKKSKKKQLENEDMAAADGCGINIMSSLNKKIQSVQSNDNKTPSKKRLKQLHREKINQIRSQHRINVHGSDVPDPVVSFEELQPGYALNPRILQNIKDAGLKTPTPIQMQAMPLMMKGRELLACAPTGSGKTLAFSVPVLAHLQAPANLGFRAVVLSPTRELASQTYRELVRLSEGVGFRVHIIDKASLAAKKYAPHSKKKYDILVSTPNRLVFLLKQEPPAIDLSRVEWLVVDESDKLFEDGKRGFREQLATVFLACCGPKVRWAFFSATCTPEVEQWCRQNLDNLVSVNIGHRNTAVETVEQELLFVGSENGKLVAMRDIVKKGFLPPMLVFVQSIERAKELFHEFVYEGINVDVIHAERTQLQRDNVVNSFRSGKIWVLICTALLARGIDFKGVNLVVNYDFPTSAVEYIHRIGRTGRAGHQGKAVTFFTEADKPMLRSIANVIKQAGCPVPDYMIGFKKLHSKMKRRLEKKPPKRNSISTTPRFLKKKVFDKKSGETQTPEARKKKTKTKPTLKKQKEAKKRTKQHAGKKENTQQRKTLKVKTNKAAAAKRKSKSSAAPVEK